MKPARLLARTDSRVRPGFTMPELVAIVAVVTVLVALLVPVFLRSREEVRRGACQVNLKVIGQALAQYTADYDKTLPWGLNCSGPAEYNGKIYDRYTLHWHDILQPYLKSTYVLRCPSFELEDARNTYGINSNISGCSNEKRVTLAQLPSPSSTANMVDAINISNPAETDPAKWTPDAGPDWEWSPPGYFDTSSPRPPGSRPPHARHLGVANVLYVDGRVQSLSLQQLLGPLPNGYPYGDPQNSWDNK